jgi:membrane protein YqaA with SNARE-associated domain
MESREQIIEEEELQLKLKMEVEEVEEENEHIKEIQKLEHTTSIQGKPLLEKLKVLLFHMLQKYGFITVLLFASIPNPLFDLAGIMCGHFKIPFRTFFGATFIGKAVIKVHIQMLFIIAIFRKQTVENILKYIQ